MLIRHLLESFSAPYPYKEAHAFDNAVLFSFDANKSRLYTVKFVMNGRGSWNVMFYLIGSWGSQMFRKTATGDEFRVFATVLAIIKEFVNTRKPYRVSFDADIQEMNRVNLYTTLAQRYTPPEYTCDIRKPTTVDDDPDYVNFTFTHK